MSSWTNGGDPDNIRWGILYNDSHGSDMAIAFYDFGGVIDLNTLSSPLTITWGSVTPNGNVFTVGSV